MSRFNGLPGIRRIAVGDGGEHFFLGGIDDAPGAAVGGAGPFAVDELLLHISSV